MHFNRSLPYTRFFILEIATMHLRAVFQGGWRRNFALLSIVNE